MGGLFFAPPPPVKGYLLGVLAAFPRLTAGALAVASLPDLLDPKTRYRGIAAIAGVAIGFAAWWGYIAILTHDFWGYLQGSPSWYLMDTPTGSFTGLASILNAKHWAVWVTGAFVPLYLFGEVALFR